MAATLPSDVLIRLRLASELVSAYELQAAEINLTLEELMEQRLTRFISLNSSHPLIFSDDDRHILESLLGKNFRTPLELLNTIRSALSIRIGGKLDSWATRLELKPNLVQRLHSRCFGKPFDEFLKQTIVEGLEQFVGLR